MNDKSVDGFLSNLRDPEKFIVTDAKWDAMEDATSLGSIERPNSTTLSNSAVGLLNMYEYQMSYKGTSVETGYLNNNLYWWTLTPYNSSSVRFVDYTGNANMGNSTNAFGIRPSINLKTDVRIISGSGTENDPYRLDGDNDANLSGTLLSSRYSGEYLQFGTGKNNLYRIVSHENGNGTKITSAEPLKNSINFIISAFNSNSSTSYSKDIEIGTFLNVDYLDQNNGYLTTNQLNMIENSTVWYLGELGRGVNYKFAKYTNVTDNIFTTNIETKVGLLRMGELMSGQFNSYNNNTNYWTLTPYSTSFVRFVLNQGYSNSSSTNYSYGIKPALNLKSNVVITGGNGTKNRPFTIELQ